jgi:hypothetical protein
MRSMLCWLLMVSLWAGGPLRAADGPAPDFARDGRPFIEKYCISCHGGNKPKAELSLEPFKDSDSLIVQRKVWDNVLRQVRTGEMPPKVKPSAQEVEAFTDHVRAVFSHHDRNAKPDPGRVTMRRLNRVEYRNTIRDLIGIDFDPTEDFPSDDIGHGFDNIGDVLTLSPVLMERYLAAAETIMARAITPEPPAVIKRHLSTLYAEPASGDIDKKVMESKFRRVASDGKEPIELGPLHSLYQWQDDGEYIFRTRVYASSGGDHPVRVAILVTGKQVPNVATAAQLAELVGNVPAPASILKTFDIKTTDRKGAQTLEVKVPAMAGRERMMVALYKPAQGKPPAKLYVEHLALEGPLDTRPASQRRLLAATQGKPQAQQTREALTRFLRRAYRRTATPDEVDRSVKLVEKALAAGEKWESAMQLAMQAALCSPKFLFRVELDDRPTNPQARPIDEFHLASRLSYFLWSSMPDDELLDLAQKKQLSTNLDAQVRRMLADARSSALVQNFALQWLQLKRLEWIAPDGQLFPGFNDQLRGSMLKETELFFESILREDRSVIDLIDADYTFLNEPLARHYGIADTQGNRVGQKPGRPGGEPIRGPVFRRVSLQDRQRGGLLTQASVLTVTSNPTRTSPVKRGRWVLEQVLGAPPPPPPPNVPELETDAKAITAGSLRKRMEEHRANPSCANCHAKMDPIGFALENFDAVGAFRSRDGAFPIDASGTFPDGSKFQGPEDLKSIIKLRKEEFARCLAEKMLIYSLGRGLEHYDTRTVNDIVKALAEKDFRFSVLVMRIVQSDAFRQRRGSEARRE